jgi:hypothetical protein
MVLMTAAVAGCSTTPSKTELHRIHHSIEITAHATCWQYMAWPHAHRFAQAVNLLNADRSAFGAREAPPTVGAEFASELADACVQHPADQLDNVGLNVFLHAKSKYGG